MKSIGFNFNNSYFTLTEMLMAKVLPTKVKDPKLVILNHELAKQLGLNFSSINPQQLAELFCQKEQFLLLKLTQGISLVI